MKKRRLLGHIMRMILMLALILTLIVSFGLWNIGSAEPSNNHPLVVEMEHMILNINGNEINVMDIMNVKNAGDTEYKGEASGSSDQGQRAVFRENLPAGATNLKVMLDDKSVVKTDTSFYTTQPIPAQQTTTITYSYNLPQQGGHYIVSLKRLYRTESVNVLLAQATARLVVQDREMQDHGLIEIEGKKFHVYSTESLEPGQPLDLIVLSDPGAAQNETKQAATVTRKPGEFHNPGHIRMWNQSQFRSFNPHVLLGVLAGILLFAIGYFGYRRWKDQRPGDSFFSCDQEALLQQLDLKQAVILKRLVELEEAYENGEMGDEEFQERKKAYRDRLLEVKLKMHEFM